MKKTPVLIDMNLTEDFAAGLMVAAREESIDILGISLSFGETDLDTALQNTAGMLQLLQLKTEVALGADRPWRRDYQIEMRPMPLCSAINGLQLDPDARCRPVHEPAWEFLYEKLKKAGEKVTLLCAGPLTNIAYLLESHPDAKDHIDKLVWRGGTQRHATLGIVKDLQTYLDPDAASYVLQQHLDLVVCPVDMGFEFYATQAEVDAGIGLTDPVAHQYNRLLKKLWCEQNESVPMGHRDQPLKLQDVAAVLYLVYPELFTSQKFYCEVDLKGKYTFGMAMVDIDGRLNKKPEELNIDLLRTCDRAALIAHLY